LRLTVICENVVLGLKSARLALILRGWGAA
jgi:hypothetical protein